MSKREKGLAAGAVMMAAGIAASGIDSEKTPLGPKKVEQNIVTIEPAHTQPPKKRLMELAAESRT